MSVAPILVAVDPFTPAEPVVAEAVTLARQLGARLVLVHVVPLPAAWDEDVLANPGAHPAVQAMLGEGEAAVLPLLRNLARSLGGRGVEVELRVGHGQPAGVVEIARQLGASLVVVGTHGRKGLARFALGSVAEAIVRSASVPVVVVPLHEDDQPVPVVHRAVDLGRED